jgi:hypothetical protein
MILLALPQRSKFGACQMEDEGEKSGVPAKVDALGSGARLRDDTWPLATRPIFPQSWKFTAITRFSARSGIQVAGEAANRDGLKWWVAERAIDVPWLGRRSSLAVRSSWSKERRN